MDIATVLPDEDSSNTVHAGNADGASQASIIVSILLCSIGIFSNLLVILLVIVPREFRKTTHSWYILQIAIANTLFLFTLSFGVSEKINKAWIYSTALCKTKETVLFLNYYSSIIFLTILSVDRYVSVRQGFSREGNSKRWMLTFIVTGVTWIASISFCVPIMLYSGKFLSGGDGGCKCSYDFPNPSRLTGKEFCLAINLTTSEQLEDCLTWAPQYGKNELACPDEDQQLDGSGITFTNYDELYASGDALLFYEDAMSAMGKLVDDNSDILTIDCHYHNHGEPLKMFIYINFILMFLIPFLIIGTAYAAIAARLQKQKRTKIESIEISSITTETTSPETMSTMRSALPTKNVHKRHSRVTLMCVLYVTTFVIGWLPFHASHLAKTVGIRAHPKSNLCRNLSIGSSLLAYAHAAVNPLLYIFAAGIKPIKRALGYGKRRVILATTAFTKTFTGNSSSVNHVEWNATSSRATSQLWPAENKQSQGEASLISSQLRPAENKQNQDFLHSTVSLPGIEATSL